MNKVAKFGSSQLKLLFFMYVGYAVLMIMRQSLMAISPDLIADPYVGLTKTKFGEMLAYGNLGGLVGKIIFGWSADRFGGKLNFFVVLTSVALFITCFGLNTNFYAFCFIFFLISVTKSGGWPSLAKMIEHWYHPSQYGRVWGAISTASRVGTIVATLGFGYLLRYLSWSQTLYAVAGIGIVYSIIWFLFVKERPKEEIIVDPDFEVKIDTEHRFHEKSLNFALLDFLKSKRVWLIFVAMMGLTVLMNFLDFVPIFLKETLNMTSSDAVMTATAFPLGAFFAVLIGGYIFDTMPAKMITKTMGTLLTISVLCIVLILNLSYFQLEMSQNIKAVWLCLFTFGFSISPAFYLPMSIFSIKYGGVYSGALICILDIGGFFAAAVSAYTVGWLSDQTMGWHKVLYLLIGLGIITMILTVMFLHGEAKEEEKALA
ncbi:MAG: hypothetical protein COB02_14125 [Candidatus Cloacimonadota bacterium]|nr:MAG: hypothetical protein COB02_14125 [Candidatus Cloacimonadota bacterium]